MLDIRAVLYDIETQCYTDNPALALSIRRFCETLDKCSTSVQKQLYLILEDFIKRSPSTFEQVNFFCQTRLLLQHPDHEARLQSQVDLIQKAEQNNIRRSLQSKSTTFNIWRFMQLGLPCAFVFLFSLWLWPKSAIQTDMPLSQDAISKVSHKSDFATDNSKVNDIEKRIELLITRHLEKQAARKENRLLFLENASLQHYGKHVESEQARIKRWLTTINNDPQKLYVYNNLNVNQKTLIVGIIESKLSPNEISPSGALGIFQIMPGLNGAYGSPAMLKTILAENPLCLPRLSKSKTTRALKQYRHLSGQQKPLLLFELLKAEQRKRSYFWQQFTAEQKKIYTSIACGQWLASKYMENIEKNINGLNPKQAEYLSVMAYNMGLENSKRLATAMKKENLAINPNNIINYIDDKNFEAKIAKIITQQYQYYSKRSRLREVTRTVKRMKEARTYLARYLVTKQLLQKPTPSRA